jgi:hypothetical protein
MAEYDLDGWTADDLINPERLQKTMKQAVES